MSSFKEKIQKNKIKQPTQVGFRLADWDSAWEKQSDKSTSDAELYLAGKVVFKILGEIRNGLEDLYKRSPNIRNEDLIKTYIGLSNRDRAIISKYDKNNYKQAANILSATINTNNANNELTFQEVADTCVDGLENAIRQCVKRMQNGQSVLNSENPMDNLEFISRESLLSQLYGMHENYWHALLWGEYRFIENDKVNKIYAIVQEKTSYEISATYSQIRKQKLAAQLCMIASQSQLSRHFDNDMYVSISKKGKKLSFPSKKIANAATETAHLNSTWRTQEIFLEDEFPADVLKDDSATGFSVLDALNVARCLMLLSWQFTDRYPQDDSVCEIKKLIQFCPRTNKLELAKGLAKATGYAFKKVKAILEFVEYKGEKGQDLWCNPIIYTNNNEYAILTSSLVTPNITRMVEHWLVQLNMNISEKGESYEKTVINRLNDAFRCNALIDDFDNGICRRFKLKSGEEEIDLLARVGNTVLLCEAKSIVTSDSPISQHRALDTLQLAASQVKRKSKFLNENMQEIFTNLGWSYDSATEYEVVGCIINSGRMFVGTCVDEVPVVDEKVLSAYFTSGTIPLFSTFEKGKSNSVHLSWFSLYDNFEELQNNLKRYLVSPPQIIDDADLFEYKFMKIPCVNNDLYKIFFARLVPADVKPEELLKRTHSFQLKSVDNINEELSSIDVCF